MASTGRFTGRGGGFVGRTPQRAKKSRGGNSVGRTPQRAKKKQKTESVSITRSEMGYGRPRRSDYDEDEDIYGQPVVEEQPEPKETKLMKVLVTATKKWWVEFEVDADADEEEMEENAREELGDFGTFTTYELSKPVPVTDK